MRAPLLPVPLDGAGTGKTLTVILNSGVLGILVHGDNHFIVRGPEPEFNTALALVRHWSIIQIGSLTPPELAFWQISTREFREDLKWAIVVEGDTQMSPAVAELLAELSARGVAIRRA